jgi:hypothetical protein
LTGLVTLLLEVAIKYLPQELCANFVAKCQAVQIERWTEPSADEQQR